MERWRDVKGYEGLYQVSDLGQVKNSKGQIRKQTLNKNGYLYVNLCKAGKVHNIPVHRLVALAFVETANEGLTVNHKNEVKTDNRACNLEWMTLDDNLRYGTHFQRSRKNRKGKLTGPSHFNYGKLGADSHTHKGKVIGISVDDPLHDIQLKGANMQLLPALALGCVQRPHAVDIIPYIGVSRCRRYRHKLFADGVPVLQFL